MAVKRVTSGLLSWLQRNGVRRVLPILSVCFLFATFLLFPRAREFRIAEKIGLVESVKPVAEPEPAPAPVPAPEPAPVPVVEEVVDAPRLVVSSLPPSSGHKLIFDYSLPPPPPPEDSFFIHTNPHPKLNGSENVNDDLHIIPTFQESTSIAYNPYPEFNSPAWKAEWNGTYQQCMGPAGVLLDPKQDNVTMRGYHFKQSGRRLASQILNAPNHA